MKPVPLPADPRERAETLRQFGGLWIAIWKDQVVAAADKVDDVFWALDHDKKEWADAAVTRIPDPKRGVPIGLG
ncbi:MAG TPA: DUF5678 domain-containing protein [Actinomycetota bacterium]|nr:DUF5678 domain-containing protein [Actinomycetota bacterium]